MSRQRRNAYKKHTSGSKSNSLALVWLTLGILLGFVIMGMSYIFFTQHPPQAEKKSFQAEKKKEVVPKTLSKKSNQRFEFYNLLPGMEVELPEKEFAPSKVLASKEQNKPKEKTKISNYQYLIQAGIFQEVAAADALKARLALLGLIAQIQKVQTQEEKTWFRVTLGPFESEALALNQKKRLEEQKIHGILILQRLHE